MKKNAKHAAAPVALVTGGTRGIGFGIAQALAASGYNLMLCGMRPKSQVADALRELEKHDIRVYYRAADIGSASARRKLLETTRSRFGRLNVLVNNAGVAPEVRADILEATEKSFARLIRINLQGPYFLTQAAANWMIAQRRRHPSMMMRIINISSISATVASPSRGEYCVAKAGLSMATRLWAVRLGEYDIPVYEVRPGVTRTDMTSAVRGKYDKLIAQGLCLQSRWGTPEDVGRAVAALAGESFAYSTGQVIMVDGGLVLPRL